MFGYRWSYREHTSLYNSPTYNGFDTRAMARCSIAISVARSRAGRPITKQGSYSTHHNQRSDKSETMTSELLSANHHEDGPPNAQMSQVALLLQRVAQLESENARLQSLYETNQKENKQLKKMATLFEKQRTQWMKATAAVRDDSLWSAVSQYTKTVIFRSCKFIATDEMLNSISKNSIGELVMNHFRVDMVDRFAWWLTYKESVHRAIKEARNGKAREIKSVFSGRFF